MGAASDLASSSDLDSEGDEVTGREKVLTPCCAEKAWPSVVATCVCSLWCTGTMKHLLSLTLPYLTIENSIGLHKHRKCA